MTEQEKINEEIKKQLAIHDAKFTMIMEELRQQREDMRRAWERQDAMQAKIDADMKASQAKHDAEMHEMNQRFYEKFDDMNKKIDENFKTLSNQIHANFIQTMLGFGAIAAAVGGLVLAAFK